MKFVVIIVLLAVILMVTLYAVVSEKHYNSVFAEYVSGRIIEGDDGFEQKVRSLRTFIHENVSPVKGEENRLDTVSVEKLTSGIGWCDQMSRVFMQLARKQGITTRLLFLLKENGSSPHSIAEAWDGERWVVVDPGFNLELSNKDGVMASREDIEADVSILRDNSKVKMFTVYNPIWEDEDFLAAYFRTPMYINTKKASRHIFLNWFPRGLRKFLVYGMQEIYILKQKHLFTAPLAYLLFRARNYQLTGRTDESEKLYKKIIKEMPASTLKDKTRYFLALLLKEQGRYDEGINVLTEMINECENSHWVPYAYGFRASLYRTVGDEAKAEQDFKGYERDPDAYF